MRIEPPASLPCAIGTIRAATAAPAPPLEPPGVRPVSQGLCVGPKRSGSVMAPSASSGAFVLPTVSSPARLNRRISSLSSVDT